MWAVLGLIAALDVLGAVRRLPHHPKSKIAYRDLTQETKNLVKLAGCFESLLDNIKWERHCHLFRVQGSSQPPMRTVKNFSCQLLIKEVVSG